MSRENGSADHQKRFVGSPSVPVDKGRGGVLETQAAGSGGFAYDVGPMDVFEKVAWVALHLMVFLIPVAIGNLSMFGIGDGALTNDQFDMVKLTVMRLGTLVALVAWAWGYFTGRTSLRTSKVFWIVGAFLVWVCVATAFSISPLTSLFGKYRRYEGLITFVNYAAVFFLVVQMVDRPSRIRSIAMTLVCSGMFVALYGIVQYLGADPVSWGTLSFEANRAFSTFGNPDILGAFIVFPLIIALALALTEDDQFLRVFYWIGFFLVTVCWIATFTRGAWIGGFVGLAVLAVIVIRNRIKITRIDLVFLALAAAGFAYVVAKSIGAESEVMNFAKRFSSILDVSSGSAATRFQIWQAAIAAIKESPIVGWGADTFRLIFPMFKPAEYVQAAGTLSVADNAHNYMLQTAVGLGIPGFLLLYGVFTYVAAKSAPTAFRRGSFASERKAAVLEKPVVKTQVGVEAADAAGVAQIAQTDQTAEATRIAQAGLAAEADTSAAILYGAFWAACAAYLVVLCFGLSLTGSTFFLWLSLGMLIAARSTVRGTFSPAKWRRAAGIVSASLITVVCAVLFVGACRYIYADASYLEATNASSSEKGTLMEKAYLLSGGNDQYLGQAGYAWLSEFSTRAQNVVYARSLLAAQSSADTSETTDIVDSSDVQITQDDIDALEENALEAYDEAERLLTEAINLVPTEYDNYVFLANLYNTAATSLDSSYADKAVEVCEKGIALCENGPSLRVQYAKALSMQGDYDEAIAQAQRAVELDSNYVSGWLCLAQVELDAGNSSEALDAYKTVLELEPSNSTALNGVSDLEDELSGTETTVS